MAISVRRGVLEGGRRRVVHGTVSVSDGVEIAVRYRQESGPPGLGLRIQAKRAFPARFTLATRWDTVYEWDDIDDADAVADTRSFGLRPRGDDTVVLRAVVYARAPAEADRSYTLTVSSLEKN